MPFICNRYSIHPHNITLRIVCKASIFYGTITISPPFYHALLPGAVELNRATEECYHRLKTTIHFEENSP